MKSFWQDLIAQYIMKWPLQYGKIITVYPFKEMLYHYVDFMTLFFHYHYVFNKFTVIIYFKS